MKIIYQERPEDTLSAENKSNVTAETDRSSSDNITPPPDDPTVPDLSYLRLQFAEALKSFYATMRHVIERNPVDGARLAELAAKAGAGSISAQETAELKTLKVAAVRQGRAVGGVYGFFLKYKPYPMLAEIRDREKLFQPPFGPVIVVDGDCVRDVLSRHDDFTVDPYGREMVKSMTPEENGGFDTFILSTDDAEKYIKDKKLLTAVVNRSDPARITDLVHQDCLRRVKQAVDQARANGRGLIDVVSAVARMVPVTLAHHYLGVPAVKEKGRFELTFDMLRYYDDKIAGPDGKTPLPTCYERPDGSTVDLPDSALTKSDGVIPDELQIYLWIKAAFRNFFNNVQKDVEVQAHGVRAYRELLVYILRELNIQRAALQACKTGPDTMLTRLLKLQMGIADPAITPPPEIDPRRLNDLRIAENVMGTIVGAIAGQEEATCRMIDSMIRLKEGDYAQGCDASLSAGQRYGSFAEARQLAHDVLEQRNVAESRRQLHQYVLEALRLQPQGEILLRECASDGATISSGRPIRAGTLIFAAHGSAMQDTDNADAFIIRRDEKHYLQFGYGRHKCLGQHVSPVIMVETLIALLALDNLRRPEPRPGESAFPLERRFGRLQLDENNIYADTFTLEFDHDGTTNQYFG